MAPSSKVRVIMKEKEHKVVNKKTLFQYMCVFVCVCSIR